MCIRAGIMNYLDSFGNGRYSLEIMAHQFCYLFKRRVTKLLARTTKISIWSTSPQRLSCIARQLRDACNVLNQEGLRPGRGYVAFCTNALGRVLGPCNKLHQITVASFIYFHVAFNSVNRDSPWKLSEADAVPSNFTRMSQV